MKNYAMITILLAAFASPLHSQTSDGGETPDAIDPSIEEQAGLSPMLPADVQPTGPLDAKQRSLFQYAYAGDLANVKALAEKGVEVDFADQQKRTPLMLAAYNGHTRMVEFLVQQGADVNAADKDSQTALTYAVKRSFFETTEFLVEHGAEVNIGQRKNGITPLMIAAVAGDLKMVQLLLDHGANPNARSTFGQTATSLAQKKGNANVVELLASQPSAGTEG